jgi:hypothetical protein
MKKTKRKMTPEELARYRVLFALRRLSPELQSDVLSDGTVVAQTGIEVTNPIKLPEGITFDRKTLFSAFQKAADEQPAAELTDIDGVKRDVQIEIDSESAYVTFDTNRVRFPHAALLSANPARRRTTADTILKNNTLTTQAREALASIISKPDYSYADFFAAINILSGSPENFANTLRDVAKKGSLSMADLLPSSAMHWENITARRISSDKLSDFLTQELAAERAVRIAEDPAVSVDVLSLTFAGPELVSIDAMRQIDPDVLLDALKRLPDHADPLALAGAFDICADHASADMRFIEVGDAIVDRLASDPKRLRDELTTFATAFVIATAHLAEHESLRKQPVFWRRLAAASHASLVTRILGRGADDEISLLTWATHLKGKAFYLSIINDAHVEPRWRPDWISPDFLAADIYGRLLGSVQRLGDAVPPSWSKGLSDAQLSMVANVPPMAHTFPGLLQGSSASLTEMPAAATPVGEMFEELAQKPTVENFLQFIQLVYAYGFPCEARDSVLGAIQSLRTEIATIPSEFAQAALDLAAFIAAQNRDVELADRVAAVAIERLVATQDVDRLLPTVSVILECAAASSDRKGALATLARRLEHLANVVSSELLSDALDSFRILQSINTDLAPLLARAIASARLGLPRTAVA